MGNLYNYEIGPDPDNTTNLEELSPALFAPNGVFTKWKEDIEIGSGHTRGAGYATATWLWGYMTLAQRDALRAFCPNASADVCIRTRDGDDQFDYYTGIIHWPKEEEIFSGMILDLEIRFTHLVKDVVVGNVVFEGVGSLTALPVVDHVAAASLSGVGTVTAVGTVV